MQISPLDAFAALRDRLLANVIGQNVLVERLLIGLLANGHLLVEGLPGLAKTRAVKSLARELDGKLSRVQFTPDLLPSDITGAEIYHQEDGRGMFRFEPGPIFANLVLADEINRAPAKVQAALLEAMEERQVTVAGTTHLLPEIFLVMATQNPIEQEGTYPLPEAQMDRFLMHVKVDYPTHAAEIDIVRLVRSEEAGNSSVGAGRSGEFAAHCAVPVQPDGCAKPSVEITPSLAQTMPQSEVLAARDAVRKIHVAPAIDSYIVTLVQATRNAKSYSAELATWIEFGASPRGALGLDKCARAHAWLAGRDHVTPDDVQAIAHDVLRHRLVLSYEASAAGITADRVIDEVLKHVAVV
ncbi:MAG: MoxR family ATPase [Rhodocyclaceae bacterium]|nr:MoxR family ATPase [Rhodocyclaceae bacterium]